MARRGTQGSGERAETLVASLDGILFAALLKAPRTRQAFLARSLGLLMSSLAGPGPA